MNNDIEWAWYDFGKAMNNYLTVDGGMGHNDFDSLILRTLIIDGEVFIRIHKEAKNPYGLSFELIDAASIDYTKVREAAKGINAIVLGVEVDKYYKPVAYYYRPGNSTSYQVGVSERIPADQMIHLFKKEFPQQVRGLPPLNAVLDDIKQIQDYRIAELMAAKSAACLGIFYERNGQTVAGDFISEGEEDDKGEFVQSLTPGMASVAPTGYNVKSLTPAHPNSGYGDFNVSILKQVAAALGISYNKMCKDYERTNYSSLRESTMDEAAYFAEQQMFIIENWKEREFKLFIESLAIDSDIIKATQVKDILKYHTWITQKRAYYDKSKDIISDKYSIEMGLKSPIMLLEEQGLDPDEVLKSFALWKTLCEQYGLDFTMKKEEPVQQNDDDVDEQEVLESKRD